MLFNKVLVVANPKAGNGHIMTTLSQYLHLLESKGIPYFSYLTKLEGNKENIQRLLETEHCDMISIIGGDGTVNIVLNSIPNLNIPLHLVPAGTGDDFAKMIYPSGDPLSSAFKAIGNFGRTTSVDVWRCNDYRFCLGFGVGFDGEVSHRVRKNSHYLFSKLKYWIAIFKLIFTYKEKAIQVNGETQESFMISMANGKFIGGNFKIAPQAILSDQLMDSIRVKKTSVLQRLYYLPMLRSGKHLDLPIVDFSQVNETTISCNTKLPAHIDGEPILDSEYRLQFEGVTHFIT